MKTLTPLGYLLAVILMPFACIMSILYTVAEKFGRRK